MDFYKNRNNKSNLSKHEIAAKLNTDVDKIKQLEERKIEIEGETFKNYIDVTNITKAEYDLEYAKLLEWYQETDIKNLRLKFGYNSQSEFADKVEIPQSVLSMTENKKTNRPSYATLLKLYNFYNNDFNKNTNSENCSSKYQKVKTDKFCLLDWEKIVNQSGMSIAQFARKLDVDYKVIFSLVNHKAMFLHTKNKVKLERYLIDNHLIDDKMNLLINEDLNIIEKQINDNLIEEQEPKSIVVDNTSKIINENNNITQIEMPTNNVNLEDIVKLLNERISNNKLVEELNKAKKDIEILEEKVSRYEKILDRLLG